MTTDSSALPEPGLGAPTSETHAAAGDLAHVRPYFWSVRRELWENRSIYIAPLVAAGLVLFGTVIASVSLSHRIHGMSVFDQALQGDNLARPFSFSAVVVIVAGIVVSVFYCLGALHNERRDRSLLFWKSLPVSDLTAVLAKATVPLVIVPLVTFAVVVVMQILMLLISSEVLLLSNLSPAVIWTRVPLPQMEWVLLYGLLAMALWSAPYYAWLLLVSSWAKRAPFLWAFLTPLAISVVEHISFHTHYFGWLISGRLASGYAAAFAPGAAMGFTAIPTMDPLRFVSSPGLWLGLAAAAAMLGGAVWMRRYRDPS